jgi:hypothetical protein
LADTAEEVEEEMEEEHPVKGERKRELARIRQAQDKIMQDVKTEHLISALRDYGYVGTPGFEADADVRRWIMGDWKGMAERGIHDIDDVVKTLLYRWTKSYGAAQQSGMGKGTSASSSSLVPGQPPTDGQQSSHAQASSHAEGALPPPLPEQESHTSTLQTASSNQHHTADFFEHGTGHMSQFEMTVGSNVGQSQGMAPLSDQHQVSAGADVPNEPSDIDAEAVREQDAEAGEAIEPSGPAPETPPVAELNPAASSSRLEPPPTEACPAPETSPVASSSRPAPPPLPADDADADESAEEQNSAAEPGKQAEGSARHRPTGGLRPARSTKSRTSEPTRRSSRVRGADDK